MKALKLWTGKSRVSDGKGKELADISKTGYEKVPGRVGFMEVCGSFGGIQISTGLFSFCFTFSGTS